MNREQRRRMARAMPRAEREAMDKGAIPVPLSDPRLVEAARAVVDDLNRCAPEHPAQLAGLERDRDLAVLADLAFVDLRQRVSADEVSHLQEAVHLLAWGIAIGRKLSTPQVSVRTLRHRHR